MRENSTLDAHRNTNLLVQDEPWNTVECCVQSFLSKDPCLKDWINRAWKLLRESDAFSGEDISDCHRDVQHLFWIYTLLYIYHDFKLLMEAKKVRICPEAGYMEKCVHGFVRMLAAEPGFDTARAIITEYLQSGESNFWLSDTGIGKLDDSGLQTLLVKIIYTKRKQFFITAYNYYNHNYLKILCLIANKKSEWIKNSTYPEIRAYIPAYMWIREGMQIVVS